MSAAQTVCSLCHEFYAKGWMTGTGGAMTLIEGDRLYVTPSGVFKEQLDHGDLYIMHKTTRAPIDSPQHLKQSDSTPVFLRIHDLTGAGCCIHSHSQNAVLAARLGSAASAWTIEDQEMIKGIRRGGMQEAFQNTDRISIPVIDNKPTESQLTEDIAKAIQANPEAPAVLIRGHGVYLWAEDWKKAKIAIECLDYLFELSVKLQP